MIKPLITVVIPVYNVEFYIEKCINSIIDQTYKSIEIIIINDGSTDSSGSICDDYVKKDERIRLIHIPNSGVSVARNIGLEQMKGEYVMFIDSDDHIASETILCNLEKLISSNSDIVQFPIIKFDNLDQKSNDNLNTISEDSVNKEEIISGDVQLIDSWIQRKIITNYVCNKLYTKAIWSNLRFPIGKRYEDRFIMSNILLSCKTLYLSNCGRYYYRQHENQVVKRKRDYFVVSSMLNANMNTIKNIAGLLPDISSSFSLVFWDSISLYKELKMIDESRAREEFNNKLNSYKINPYIIAKSEVPIGIKLRLFIYYFAGIK